MNFLEIEVAYAKTNVLDQQLIIPLQVRADTTIKQAIELSNILKYYPELDLQTNQVGIYGEVKPLNYIVKPGDRVEIYNDLLTDPNLIRKSNARKSK